MGVFTFKASPVNSGYRFRRNRVIPLPLKRIGFAGKRSFPASKFWQIISKNTEYAGKGLGRSTANLVGMPYDTPPGRGVGARPVSSIGPRHGARPGDPSRGAVECHPGSRIAGERRRRMVRDSLPGKSPRYRVIERWPTMDVARVVGTGRHAELMQSCPVYREIVSSQLSPEESA